VPQESPGSHLKLLANASRLLHDARCRARLMQAPDERAVLAVLRAEEDRATGASRAA
jgi:mannitol/fructose-specific phosphotransferase system IIA component (Ntr-type)